MSLKGHTNALATSKTVRPWVGQQQSQHQEPRGGTVLTVACAEGRNATIAVKLHSHPYLEKRGDAHGGASPAGLVNRTTTVSEPVYNILKIQTQLTAFVNTTEADVIRWPRLQPEL